MLSNPLTLEPQMQFVLNALGFDLQLNNTLDCFDQAGEHLSGNQKSKVSFEAGKDFNNQVCDLEIIEKSCI